jgi:predicted NAD/FAD-dependent oxidoreductase
VKQRDTLKNKSVLIIGAGISGLLAADLLSANGFRVTILEKSRGVGGRMATRRFDGGVFDHGAQFFTVRSDRFKTYVKTWTEKEIVKVWSNGFPPNQQDGHPRYIGVEGMTAIAKKLADNLAIQFGERALFLDFNNPGWSVQTDKENIYTADALILTSPVPQSVLLLQNGTNEIKNSILDDLNDITYDPCLGLMMTSDEKSGIDFPGAYQLSGEPIAWISDNHIKGISKNRTAITVHAGPEFSRKYWELDDKTLISTLYHTVSDWIPVVYKECQIKRWRFSQPRVIFDERTLFLSEPAPIALAGDAFGGPKIEGASLSGLAAADKIMAYFS